MIVEKIFELDFDTKGNPAKRSSSVG